jgi:uncharacterized protein (TIGR00369 family)
MTAERSYGVVPREVLTGEDGLTFLRGVLDGRHPSPPISETLGFAAAEVEEGRVVFRGKPSPAVLNPLGTVHGGWAATLLDSAMACAVHATLKAGEAYTTLEMKLNYVRPILPDIGEVVCEGRVVHRGASVATSEGRLTDARGKLLAHGTETCLIFDPAARARG